MCTINGAIRIKDLKKDKTISNKEILDSLIRISRKGEARGKDGIGVYSDLTGILKFKPYHSKKEEEIFDVHNFKEKTTKCFSELKSKNIDCFLTHNRAIPESEISSDHTQPIETTDFIIIHNGIIANDDELFKKTGYKNSILQSKIDTEKFAWALNDLYNKNKDNSLEELFLKVQPSIEGSFAFAIYNKTSGEFLLTTNFQPLAYKITNEGYLLFSSLKEYIQLDSKDTTSFLYNQNIVDLPAYNYIYVSSAKEIKTGELIRDDLAVKDPTGDIHSKGLVLASGGLDTCVVAGIMKQNYNCKELTFLHFDYGHKVEEQESKALKNVVEAYGAKLITIKLDFLKELFKDSPLLTGAINEDGKGMEVSLEYVPTRNLLFLSMAASYAEVNGFNYIGFGGNLSESMAYPDTTSIFIQKINELLAHSIGANRNIKVLDPLKNLLKHEIISEGLKVKAPMNLTWSCYQDDGSGRHCGKCASCRLRANGMNKNGLTLEGLQI